MISRSMVSVPLLGLVLLTACGDDSDSDAGSSITPSTTVTSTSESSSSRPPTTSQEPSPSPAPAAGTAFDGENLTAAEAAALQQSVDEGHQPWRLDVRSVAETFMQSHYGWGPADYELADPHTVEATHHADGRIVSLQLRKPVRAGDDGIWVVDSGVWIT